jgi:hypothetical protein
MFFYRGPHTVASTQIPREGGRVEMAVYPPFFVVAAGNIDSLAAVFFTLIFNLII